jgi:predicted transcriptional regulator
MNVKDDLEGEHIKTTRFPEISRIKQTRNSLGMTQSLLAKRASVSQSTIAKIERGIVKGSYPEVVRLFEALEDEKNRQSTKVRLRDICTKNVIGVQSNDQVRKASELMKEFDISQMPVFEGDKPIGSINEKSILRLIMNGASPDEVNRRPVRTIMDDPFPVVGEEVEKESVEPLILAEHAVLTTKNGKITGIVTSADMILMDWVI